MSLHPMRELHPALQNLTPNGGMRLTGVTSEDLGFTENTTCATCGDHPKEDEDWSCNWSEMVWRHKKCPEESQGAKIRRLQERALEWHGRAMDMLQAHR